MSTLRGIDSLYDVNFIEALIRIEKMKKTEIKLPKP